MVMIFMNKHRFKMKYRRLDKEELEELEQEFIKFLAVNTVTADDWAKIQWGNSNAPQQGWVLQQWIEIRAPIPGYIITPVPTKES